MEHIFDSHAHYDDDAFDADREAVLASLPAEGVVGILNCGCSVASSEKSLELAEKHDFIYAACGIHPQDADTADIGDIKKIAALCEHEKCVAVGEIGLDYHYGDAASREMQLRLFEEQLRLSALLSLPVVVHDREAHGDTLALLKKYKPRGVMHCFSGSAEMLADIVKLGMYVGLGGAVTFKNAVKPLETARLVPSERLLLETDCPYMSPVPFRGKRCHSGLISFTATAIAAVRGCDVNELTSLTEANAKTLFNIQ